MARSMRISIVLIGSLLPIALILVWHILCSVGFFPPNILPAPLVVLETVTGMVKNGTLWKHVAITLYRVSLGFLLGTGIAVIFGALVGFYPFAKKIFDPVLQAFRSIPSMAWVPLFILWMGISEAPKIALIAVGVFFPIYLNLVSGILGVDRKLIEVGKVYGFTHGQLIGKIILPASLPSFLVGLRGGLGVGWMFVVAAELMGASQGLGYLLVFGQNTTSPEIILASIVLFAILGKTTDAILAFGESKALHWQDTLAQSR